MAKTRDAEGTRQKLMDAAVELLRRDGPLNGVTLEDVARRAGVTATNVYHHFGNKQGLLRATIQRGVEQGRAFYSANRDRALVERRSRIFRTAVDSDVAGLEALLVLDGADIDPMPHLEASISDLRRDVIERHLREDEDLEALHVLLVALRHGYTIFRRCYAERTDIPVAELDERLAVLIERLLRALGPQDESTDT